MTDAVALLQRLAPHLTVAHHTQGRIRLRLAPAGVAELDPANAAWLQRLQAVMPGVREVDVNPLARSITVRYDPQRYPKACIERLAEGILPPEIKLDQLAEALP